MVGVQAQGDMGKDSGRKDAGIALADKFLVDPAFEGRVSQSLRTENPQTRACT